MNERIKELAEQAGLYDFVIESMGINEEMEKFAELIVAECIGICNDTNDASYLNGVIAGRKIREHFGVEE